MPKFRTTDDLSLAYYVDDSTRPWTHPDTVLLLHPAMGSARRYFAWIPRLSRTYRVVRMDMRGHGNSDVPAPGVPLTMDRLVADVLELLDHTDSGAVHIVGTSAGGYIAQNIALSHPGRVKSLSLFSSTPGLRGSNWPVWIDEMERIGLREWLADNLRGRLPVDRLEPAHVEWFLDEAAQLNPRFGAQMVRLMSSLDWSDRLAEIRCPTLLVRPGAASIGNEDMYEIMRERIPDSRLLTYEGLPHHLTDAVPERCVGDVLNFLRERSPETPGSGARKE
jgi:pimeloyl-ACP methyl ester carboxylesterase